MMLRRTLGENIEIESKLQPDIWLALADKAQVENALLNLAINSRDAMAAGGRLTIESANVRLDADYASRHADVAPGDYVMLAVTDTGTGIPPEIMQRVFEPFFTTKEVGKGTGLGLSMVYGFAKQSGGHVRIYTEIGHGTTVRLYLPRATPAPGSGSSNREEEQAAVPGNETILVVEDNAGVRELAVRQLKSLGYAVIEVPDGPCALVVIESATPVDLLFTDVVMPGGIGGLELAEECRRLRPTLKVLFTSGYTRNSIVHQGKVDPGVHLLSKPYKRNELALKVREALGDSR